MHESAAPDRDLYALLGVDRGRTAIQLHSDLDERLRLAKRDAGKGAPSMSADEWDATVIGRDILGYAARKARYDAMLAQGHQPTWTELEQLASAPMGRQARLAVIVVIAIVALGVVVALVQYFTGSGDDTDGPTAAVVDSSEVVYAVGDSGTVVQVDEAIDMTQVAPEAADLGLCEGQVCRGTGSEPAVGETATGDIAAVWPGHQVTVSPSTGEIVDYNTATYPTRAEREAILVDQSECAWVTALYRVGDDGEITEDDITYYETDDGTGTVWFVTLNDRGTLFQGTVVKR